MIQLQLHTTNPREGAPRSPIHKPSASAAPGPSLEEGRSWPVAVPRPPSPCGSWQSSPSPPQTRAQEQATRQEAVTTDRLGNEASISYLIEDFIDKSHFTISCWTRRRISKDWRAQATAVSRPSPCPFLRELSRQLSPLSGKAVVVSGTLRGLRGSGGWGGHGSGQHITNC